MLPDIAPMSSQPQTPAQPTQPASLVFRLLASVEGSTVCLGIPLQSPRPPKGKDRHLATPPPPHPHRGGDRRALWGYFKGG